MEITRPMAGRLAGRAPIAEAPPPPEGATVPWSGL